MSLRPLRNLVQIEKVVREKTAGGIYVPTSFDHQARPSLKFGAIPDHFEARVVAVGPDVRDIGPGDHILVWQYADGDGSKLFTGDGDAERLLIKYPDDIVCAIDLEEAAQ